MYIMVIVLFPPDWRRASASCAGAFALQTEATASFVSFFRFCSAAAPTVIEQ